MCVPFCVNCRYVSELVFDCLFSVISFAKNSIADRYWHRRFEMASNVLMPFQQILELNTWELFLQQSTVLLLDLFTVGRCHSRNHELKSFHFFAPLAILIGWSPGFYCFLFFHGLLNTYFIIDLDKCIVYRQRIIIMFIEYQKCVECFVYYFTDIQDFFAP